MPCVSYQLSVGFFHNDKNDGTHKHFEVEFQEIWCDWGCLISTLAPFSILCSLFTFVCAGAVPPHTLLEQPGAALEQPGAAWGSPGPAWSSLEQPWSSPGAVLGWPWPDSLPKRPRKSPPVPFPSLPQKSSPKFSWSLLKKK